MTVMFFSVSSKSVNNEFNQDLPESREITDLLHHQGALHSIHSMTDCGHVTMRDRGDRGELETAQDIDKRCRI